MSTSKNFDKLAISCICIALVVAIILMLCVSSGVISIEKTSKYESLLFDNSMVHTIDIQMDDWDSFIETCENEEYSICNLVIDGSKISNVGIRGKGNTSLSSVEQYGNNRYSFKIEFDHYDDGTNYYGLDKLCLNNIIQDNTYMKDYLTYTLMNEMGIAAPLCSYVYLTVNGEDFGLYLAVEAVEDSFMDRNYAAADGNLYKPDSLSFGGGRGNGKDFNMEDFEENFSNDDVDTITNPTQSNGNDKEKDNTNVDSNGMPNMGDAFGTEIPNMEGFDFGEMQNGNFGGMQMPNTEGNSETQMPNMQNFDFGENQNGNLGGNQMPNMGGNLGNQMPNMGGNSGNQMPNMGGNSGNQMPNMGGNSGNQMPNMGGNSGNQMPNMSSGAGMQMPNMDNFDFNEIKDGEFGEKGEFNVGGGNSMGMGSSDTKLQYIDDDIDSYSNIFDNAKTDASNSDKKRLISSLKTLSEYVNGEDVDVSTVVDVESVIKYFVVHNYVCNGDSYTGSMIHNYYLYEDNGVMSMIPWDYNLAFGGFSGNDASSVVNADIYNPVSGDIDDRPMLAWIFKSEEYTALYEEYFKEFLKIDINALIEKTYNMIARYVKMDPTAFCTYDEFVTAKETLQKVCALRSKACENQLNGDTTAVDASGINISDMGSMGNMGNGQGGGGFNFKNMEDFDWNNNSFTPNEDDSKRERLSRGN